MEIAGIEEAGRGPVIGPLVMAGVVIENKDENRLVDAGIRDSKLLSPVRREQLFDVIKAMVRRYKIIKIEAVEVDACLVDPKMNLNILEAKISARLIDELRPDKSYLDCPSNNIERYIEQVKGFLASKADIVAEHKADLTYPVVSAASILAKVTRDREIEKIKKEIGIDFGSGYPSDPKTRNFLERYHSKYDIFRKTWSSYSRVKERQTKLT